MKRSFGRVNLTDGVEKFMLFRSQKDHSDEWQIVEDRTYVVRKFHRQSFEQPRTEAAGMKTLKDAWNWNLDSGN